MDVQCYTKQLLEEWEEDRKNVLSNLILEKLEKAYLQGYNKRVMEEKLIIENPIISSPSLQSWQRFNYGAISETEFQSHDAEGNMKTFEEACSYRHFRLPSKDDIEYLYKHSSKIFTFNVGYDGRIWNARIEFCYDELGNHISFYHDHVNTDKELGKTYSCRIWLSDECENPNNALTVVMRMKVLPLEDNVLGEQIGEVLNPIYEEIPKDKAASVHFIYKFGK